VRTEALLSESFLQSVIVSADLSEGRGKLVSPPSQFSCTWGLVASRQSLNAACKEMSVLLPCRPPPRSPPVPQQCSCTPSSSSLPSLRLLWPKSSPPHPGPLNALSPVLINTVLLLKRNVSASPSCKTSPSVSSQIAPVRISLQPNPLHRNCAVRPPCKMPQTNSVASAASSASGSAPATCISPRHPTLG
jgi:hypothetical protein